LAAESYVCFAVDAAAAALIDYDSGRTLFGQNMHERLPMASTTKIMTALLTLEQSGLDVPFRVDSGAIMVEGSSMGLEKGDIVTLRTLAAGMLLASGNDAANAAAVRISGSLGVFVRKMNLRAREMGLADTSFETPSGLDGDRHYSSAYDLATMARAALADPDFAAICRAKSLRLEYGDPPYTRWLTNHNRLLSLYEGAIGVKTGFTKKAGRCLVSAASRGGVTLIFVTLDCGDDWNVHASVYDEYFGKLRRTDISPAAAETSISVRNGTHNTVRAASEPVFASLAEWEETSITAEYELSESLEAPVYVGDVVGSVRYYLYGEQIAESRVVAEENVDELRSPGIFERIIQFIESAVMR